MNEPIRHVQTLFQHVQPEVLMRSMLGETGKYDVGIQSQPYEVNSAIVSQACYLHAARSAFPERSDDELNQFYWDAADYLAERPMGGVFALLADYVKPMIRYCEENPICCQEHMLEWREVSFALGQDLLVCAGMARQDVYDGCVSEDFCWPIAISTDDSELKSILRQGLAENHFHLNGSAQAFPLTWGFLMNHPEQAGKYFSQDVFRENLHKSVAWSIQDNMLPWKQRIYYAAWLRANLFSEIHPQGKGGDGGSNEAEWKKYKDFPTFHRSLNQGSIVRQMVETIRIDFGARLSQFAGHRYCLDYAIDGQVDQSRPTRFLAGERKFLYDCFYRCFSGGFTTEQQDKLYLYLLLKCRFRNEIVQTNMRFGFRNFSAYDRRKSGIWGWRKEYWFEANHLAIDTTLEHSVQSLEMRITPGKDRYDLTSQIDLPDQITQLKIDQPFEGHYIRRRRAIEDERTFFVIHFIKSPLPRLSCCDISRIPELRHGKIRRGVERQAKMVAAALERSSYLCARIRGIDAASHEIGCRPEIFAAAFRFLRHFSIRPGLFVQRSRFWPTLGATYHAGEDFLDVADGLRAIDEAVCFLNLSRGDRIGHALALGIEPGEYYQLKGFRSVLPAQDLLDNLVWLLFRCLEWGVAIPGDVRCRLTHQAEDLLRELYGKSCPTATLQEYYQSWALRGDAPSLYFLYEEEEQFNRNIRMMRFSASRYDTFHVNDHIWEGCSIENCRTNERVRRLVHYYQYGMEEQWLGQRTKHFRADGDYIRLVRELQNRMMQKLMAHGIAIETNPSSNYLIGTFRQYYKHPIFRFHYGGIEALGDSAHRIQMQVSINTDDQGIFGTSLENEYALMYAAMEHFTDEQGQRLISSSEAVQYLDRIRTMGNNMVFAKARRQIISRFMP